MRLKTFTGKTSKEAMALVRATLGGEAIILATQETPGEGVRVTVAVEEDGESTVRETVVPLTPQPPVPDRDTGEAAVDQVYRALRDNAVPARVGEILLDLASDADTTDPVMALSWAMRQHFRFAPVPPDSGSPRPIMLVGPPGAGKTQTLAKMAARAMVAGQTVGIVSIDTQRTGGLARTEAFASALSLNVLAADTPEMLSAHLLMTEGSDLVLVDTDGRNHLDSQDLADLRRFLDGSAIEPILVLPDGLDAAEAAEIAGAYAGLGAIRMILTRVDLARRHGGALAAAHSAGLAFGNHSASPRIRDGLLGLDPPALASLLFKSRAQPVKAPTKAPATANRVDVPR